MQTCFAISSKFANCKMQLTLWPSGQNNSLLPRVGRVQDFDLLPSVATSFTSRLTLFTTMCHFYTP